MKVNRGVSDGGSDVKKGAALFAARHPETIVTYDAAHYDAIVLKRRFEADPQWSEYISQLGQLKSRIRQTLDAFLASPSLRPKARYMNLESLRRKYRPDRYPSILGYRTAIGALRTVCTG